MGMDWRKLFRRINSRIRGTKKNLPTRLTREALPAPFPDILHRTPSGSGETRAPVAPPGSPSRPPTHQPASGPVSGVSLAPVIINIGVDFGTSFTKVGYQDVGAEESGIVTFDTTEAMIPSIVSMDRSGRLSLGEAGTGNDGTHVRYLKMRLAGLPAGDPLPVLHDVNLKDARAISALSSWFLATAIKRSRDWIRAHEAERLTGRKPQWSGNVGLPVEHCDSGTMSGFRRVLAVAWEWASHDDVPSCFDELMTKYRKTASYVDLETTDCHPTPELAAAVQSFVTSREAAPGIYVYFDIGGGTVDGVAFRYVNQDGERRVNFYSGKVAALGAEIATAHLQRRWDHLPNDALMNGEISDAVQETLAPFGRCVQKLVAHVVMTAKEKDIPWVRNPSPPGILLLDPSKVPPLPVFAGGGGAASEWYRKTILSTHEDFQHWNAGVPPYKLTALPRPSDLSMNGLADSLFPRFAIAYGLAVSPCGQGPEIGLPSEFPPLHSKPSKEPSSQKGSIVDYIDNKDVYD